MEIRPGQALYFSGQPFNQRSGSSRGRRYLNTKGTYINYFEMLRSIVGMDTQASLSQPEVRHPDERVLQIGGLVHQVDPHECQTTAVPAAAILGRSDQALAILNHRSRGPRGTQVRFNGINGVGFEVMENSGRMEEVQLIVLPWRSRARSACKNPVFTGKLDTGSVVKPCAA